MIRIVIVTIVGLLASCGSRFNPQEVSGKYTPTDYVNCFDTINLHENGIYKRNTYDVTGLLVLEMTGKWELKKEGTLIRFHSYYHNLDDDLLAFPELVTDTLGGGEFVLDKRNGTIQFCVGAYAADLPDQNCYKKIGAQ